MQIGDVFIALRAEDAEFRRSVQNSATSAGTAASQTFGQRFNSGLKRNMTQARASRLSADPLVPSMSTSQAIYCQERANAFLRGPTMRDGTCSVCGRVFGYRGGGKPRATCSEECRILHRRRLAKVRAGRWARRVVAR